MVDQTAIGRRIAAEAVDALLRAGDLLSLGQRDDVWRVLDATVTRLTALAALRWCPPEIAEALLDLRNHLDSYALTARALVDSGVAREQVSRLARRGVAEGLASVANRLPAHSLISVRFAAHP